jgi:uncharacterized membrane protein YqjE
MNTIMHAVEWLYRLNDFQRTLVLVAFLASVGVGAWIANNVIENALYYLAKARQARQDREFNEMGD